ncbi:MAG: VCBS repeat-containing protein, partial [Sedimentisphaerales bacterium]|nr:VCBS repeat-containing protein [Sedimentisphaerales bacterium]
AAMELANIDGIPGDEMLTVDAQSGRLVCYKLGNEKKATGSSEDWPTLIYPLESGEGDTKRDLVVGDFDGNGLPDVVVSDSGAAEFIFYKQIKGVGLGEPVRFPALADIASLSAADCDHDGKAEVGVLSVKEKIIGKAEFAEDRFSFPQPIEAVGEPVAMELADINGDGDVDCVYISKDVNDVRSLKVIYNVAGADKHGKTGKHKGLDVFGEVEESSPELKLEKLSSDPEGIKVVDVDQDGRQDVLIFVKYEKPILVRQTAKGRFEVIDSPAAQASLIKDASLSSVAVADVDGRAGKELLIAQKNFARSLIFAEGRKWGVVDQYNAHSKQDVISTVAAFNIEQAPKGQAGPANRPAILLLDGQRGRLEILKAGEDGTYRFEKELDVGKWDVGAGHLKMLFAPLTGGESNSILLFDGAKFALITLPSGGAAQRLEQQFGYETEIKDGDYGNLTAGDINGDGRPDIVMVEYRHRHIEILALDWQSKPIPAMRFKIFEEKGYRDEERQGEGRVEPRELKAADVTGDGKADLVTVIHDRIIIYPQD